MSDYYFPMFVDISKKRILVIGGGAVAARRVRTLLKFADHIEVISPMIGKEMQAILEEEENKEVPQVVWDARKITPEDLKATSHFLNGADMVLTATNDRELNKKIVSACRMRSIPVNTADDKSLCDFYFPAVVEKDGIVIGINSGGKSPKIVRKIREYIYNLRWEI